MDAIVKAALAKWPHVPACYGWLGLDARGNWYLRDDQAQAQGRFGQPGGPAQAKGARLEHTKLIDFIQRNYQADAQGQWFFQNGPQRVYVELEITPWIWRIADDFAVTAHTGQAASVQACWVDENGYAYLQTTLGAGLVHSLDMALLADALEIGLWPPQTLLASHVPGLFGFVRSPEEIQKSAA